MSVGNTVILSAFLLVGHLVAQETSPSFKRLDKNGDGKLTASEFSGRIFNLLDTNQDGEISEEEDAEYYKTIQAERDRRSDRTTERLRTVLDISYASNDNPRQRLDLYFPAKVEDDHALPLIVFIHGGGWSKGDKRSAYRLLARMVEGGKFAGASIGYRLTPEAAWPAQIHDCKAAIRWLRANASQYNLDAEKIGATGLSAGGHLVSVLGTSGDVTELEGSIGDHTAESSRINCVVSQFGPTDLLQMGGWHNEPNSPESRLIGGPIQKNRKKAIEASPVHYVTEDDPPFMFIHGTKDPIVAFDQSTRLSRKLQAAGVASMVIPVEDAGHGRLPAEEVFVRLDQFFSKHLLDEEVTVSKEAIQGEYRDRVDQDRR